jgi:hypothetical protein
VTGLQSKQVAEEPAVAGDGRAQRQKLRWLVHLGLLATISVSLAFEPVIAVHVVVGLAFVGLVLAHVFQRRKTSANLARRLVRPRSLGSRAGRLALADAALMAVSAMMLASGFWDLFAGQPTKIRWHAITGVLLAVMTAVHTLRRRSRLRASNVR